MSSSGSDLITSFVFLDLETTGIPSHEYNKTSITELSMVAVKRAHLLESTSAPRVQHKLTLCLNPRRLVDPEATRTTGLCNDLLEHETHFSVDVFDTIDNFIKTLEKPVCLLAHNGITFDFPILQASLEKIKRRLPDDILCADTLHAYNDILTKNPTVPPSDETDLAEFQREHVDVDFQSQNETTPKKNRVKSFLKTPRKVNISPLNSVERQRNAKRRLCFNEMKGKTLASVYEKLVGRPAVGCHRAETDCLLNLESSVAAGEQFVRFLLRLACNYIQCYNRIEKGLEMPMLSLHYRMLVTLLYSCSFVFMFHGHFYFYNNSLNSTWQQHILYCLFCPLILVAAVWGGTNPFIKRGTKGIMKVKSNTVLGQFYAEVVYLFSNWQYVVPFLVNQCGSLLYVAALQSSRLSLAVPVANSLTFVFTALTGWLVGEQPLNTRSICGIVLIILGTILCYTATTEDGD